MNCLYQSNAWYSALQVAQAADGQVATETIISTITSYQKTWTCASTCGDVCYAESATTLGSSVIVTSWTYPYYSYIASPFTQPTPNCVIPADICTSMTSAYSSSLAAYWESNGAENSSVIWPTWPYCNGSEPICTVYGVGKATLFYWPVPETVSRDMCFAGSTSTTLAWDNWPTNVKRTCHRLYS